MSKLFDSTNSGRHFSIQEMAIENERGNPANPLKITWLQEGPDKSSDNSSLTRNDKSQATFPPQDNLTTERDFESLVMRKLRQAEERRRLCEEIAKEQEES